MITNSEIFRLLKNYTPNHSEDSSTQESDTTNKKETINLLNDGKDREGLFFSKILVISTLALYFFIAGFVLLLAVRCLNLAESGVSTNLTGLSAALSAMISVPIALPCTCIVWYLKKTQAGHTGKVMGEVYKNAADKEVECKLILMEKQAALKLSDLEVSKLNLSRVDNITSGAFNDLNSTMKSTMSDATSLVKKEGA